MAVLVTLAATLLLSSCVPLPGGSHSSSAQTDQKNLTLTISGSSQPIVVPLYPGRTSSALRGYGGLFGSTTDYEDTSGDPPADVVAFYQQKLAPRQPKVTTKELETQFEWREQKSKLTLTIAPQPGGAGTQTRLHIR